MLTAWFLAYALIGGSISSPDGTWYLESGELLRRVGWSIPAYLRDMDFHGGLPLFYLGYSAVVAATEAIFGPITVQALLALNAVALGITAFLVLREIGSASASRASQIVATVLFAIIVDQFHWTRYTLTDVTFALVCAVAFIGTRPSASARSRVVAVIVIGAALIWRPTGLLLVAFLALDVWSRHWRTGDERRALIVATLILSAMIIGGTVAGMLAGRMDQQSLAFVLDGFRAGAVVDARPETYAPAATDALHGVLLVCLRFLYFFLPAAQSFSRTHSLVGWLTIGPALSLAIVGVVRAGRLSPAARALANRAGTMVLALAAFVALTGLDFDWRYRVPAWPFIIMLAALGAAAGSVGRDVEIGDDAKHGGRVTPM